MKLLTITILYLAVYVFCVVWMLRLRIPRPPFVPIFLLLTVAALWTVLVLLPTGRLHGYMFTGLERVTKRDCTLRVEVAEEKDGQALGG